MSRANLVYSSNVWPAGHEDVLKDTAFLHVIVDARLIGYLKKKCESNNANPCLLFSDLQLRIARAAALCSYAGGDPCWGMIVRDDKATWECRCIKDECELFSKCRPDCDKETLAEEQHRLASNVASLDAYDEGKKISSMSAVLQTEKPDSGTYNNERGKCFPVVVTEPTPRPRDEFDRHLLKSPPLKRQMQGKQVSTPCILGTPGCVLHPQLPAGQPSAVAASIVENSHTARPPAGVLPLPPVSVSSQSPESAVPPLIPSEEMTGARSACMLDITRKISVDDLQRTIIEAPVDRPVFIEAGPGTGKTHVLIERVNHMVTYGGVSPEQIIVLSFTNAAVNEVRQRLRGHVDAGTGSRGLRNVDVRTFHSLAWFLLGEANANECLDGWQQYPLDMGTLDYDASVRRAGQLLLQFPDFVEGWNVIVDEVQDMTNEKAFFVLALMKACLAHGGSVAAFGDFRQSIFEYSVQTNPDPISSESFRAFMLESLNTPWLQCHLSHNHRQTEELAALAQPYREALGSNNLSEIQRELAALREAVPHCHEKLLKDPSVLEELSRNGRICLLCRKNADVIQLSTSLHTLGISHIANTHADNEGLAMWVAEIFGPETSERLSFEEFALRASDSSLNREYVEQAWESMMLMLGEKGHKLSAQDILASLQKCRRDEPLFRLGLEHAITVSTVHKAKGREYDRVIIDTSLLGPKENEQGFEEFRILYVALTRPRTELFQARLVAGGSLRSREVRPSGRKRILGFNKSNKLAKIEIRNEFDIDRGGFFFSDSNHSVNVKPGDAIRLVKKKNNGDVNYLIMHESGDVWQPVGSMQRAFLEDLKSLVKPESYADWPDSIEYLYANAVFSHIEEPAYAEKSTLEARLWIDFQGIGQLTYGTY